jgi:hypothetical protein
VPVESVSARLRKLERLVETVGLVGERRRGGRRREEVGEWFSTPRVEAGEDCGEVVVEVERFVGE